MNQITFEDYLRDKNRQYSHHCRRCIGDYCYAKRRDIDPDIQCPCSDYEEKLLCEGCVHNGKGLSYCLHDEICKRYCFSPAVSVKDLNDKWEEKTNGNH